MSASRTDRKKPIQTHSPGVRPILLHTAELTLSGLLATPDGPPRATIIAIHGGGMRAGYFDGQAHPDLSLLTLGARLGYTVLALDRPGYGHSATQLPDGLTLDEQTTVLTHALGTFTQQHPTGKGFLLLAHSYGGKLALTTAAHTPGLLALDASGVGHHYNPPPPGRKRLRRHTEWEHNWGPLHLYPPNTFRTTETLIAPIPTRETAEADQWPQKFEKLAPHITIPLRLTFAEHETWWLHDEPHITDLTTHLTKTPLIRIEHQPHTGHNISLSLAARTYHLRALAFFEECLQPTTHTTPQPTPPPTQTP